MHGAAPQGEAPSSLSRAAREEKAIQDARRQQLAEKEAALAVKEEELKKLGAKLDAQLKEMADTRSMHGRLNGTEREICI